MSGEMNYTPLMSAKAMFPFLAVGLIWGLLGSVTVGIYYDAPAVRIFLEVWAASLFELGALFKLSESVFRVVTCADENRPATVIRTSYWGFLKLISWGIFALLLTKGRTLPTLGENLGLMVGFGTLAVVPLVGGTFWSRREAPRSPELVAHEGVFG